MEFPERNFGFLLHDVARLMRKRFEQKARGLGLTRSQCSVLAHLARHEGIQQGGLAEILEIEPITLTRILDRLEQAELVERRAHPTDRRIRTVALTRKGAKIRTQVEARLYEAPDNVRALSARDLEALAKVLRKIVPEDRPRS